MTEGAPGEAERDAVELHVLREATAGDRDLMQELAELYVTDCDLQIRALDDALANKETDRLKRIGHALKGASLSVGANVAAALFQELEDAAQVGDLAQITQVIERGRAEFERVRRALDHLR